MITPQETYPELAKALGLGEAKLYFKREDLNPYGSHKGRSIPSMIDAHVALGFTHFAISSSGNAAIAAAVYCSEMADPAIKLDIYLGKNISSEKLEALQKIEADSKGTILIHNVKRPLQSVFEAIKADPKIKQLRQSTDNTALVGYESLVKELSQIPDLEAVFIPTSSGTTAEGLALHFKKSPQIHIVQTPNVHPIADELHATKNPDAREESLAGAISDKIGYRKKTLAEYVRMSNGAGWIISNDEIIAATKIVKEKTGLDISPNSALSVAGLIKARNSGFSWKGGVVCLITGK